MLSTNRGERLAEFHSVSAPRLPEHKMEEHDSSGLLLRIKFFEVVVKMTLPEAENLQSKVNGR